MLQIAKQILCFVVCAAITCGCTTTSTRTLLKYQDDGRHLTPIESYKIEQETTTYRRSKFKEESFPIYHSLVENSTSDEAFLYGTFCLWIIDLFLVPIVALTSFDTYKSVSYKTTLHTRGKVVDVSNKPVIAETIEIFENKNYASTKTNERGVFEDTVSHSYDTEPIKSVELWFPKRDVQIIYNVPFENGSRAKMSTDGHTMNPSSLPTQGNVIVLVEEAKPNAKQTSKTKKQESSHKVTYNKDEFAKQFIKW